MIGETDLVSAFANFIRFASLTLSNFLSCDSTVSFRSFSTLYNFPRNVTLSVNFFFFTN
jgi:hypothetical protein